MFIGAEYDRLVVRSRVKFIFFRRYCQCTYVAIQIAMSGITCLSYYMLNVTVIVLLDHCVNELCNYVRIDSSRDIDSEDNNNNGHCIVLIRVC